MDQIMLPLQNALISRYSVGPMVVIMSVQYPVNVVMFLGRTTGKHLCLLEVYEGKSSGTFGN